jgi:hypothetical protein
MVLTSAPDEKKAINPPQHSKNRQFVAASSARFKAFSWLPVVEIFIN